MQRSKARKQSLDALRFLFCPPSFLLAEKIQHLCLLASTLVNIFTALNGQLTKISDHKWGCTFSNYSHCL